MARSGFRLNQSGIGSFTILSTSALNVKMFAVARDIKAESIALTRATTSKKYPRTGRLARSYGARPHSRTLRRTRYRVSNRASYARYVFEGTTGPIVPKKGRMLLVGKSATGIRGKLPKGFPKSWRISARPFVDGQSANNIPMKAAHAVLTRRGFNPKITAVRG